MSDSAIRRCIDLAGMSSFAKAAEQELTALKAERDELRDLLSRCNPECGQLSHHHGEFHKAGEPCPVYKRIGVALGYSDADHGEHTNKEPS